MTRTRIDEATHWIAEDELPTLVTRACLDGSTISTEGASDMGYGEEFDLVAATLSEAPPPRAS